MANEAYQIGPAANASGYGSPGASAMFGVQQELLRRQELEQQLKDRQLAVQRQQALDELHQRQVEQEIAASKENTAGNLELRTQNAAKAKAATADATIKGITSILSPGVVPDEARQAVAAADPARAALLFAQKAVPAVPATLPSGGVPGDEAMPPSAGSPEVPARSDTQYLGTDEQRTSEEHKTFAKAVLNGDHDTGNDALDQWSKARAREILSTGKETGTIPAALVTGLKTAAETKSAHDIAIEKVLSKPKADWTSEETAMVNGRQAFNKLQGEQAAQRLNVSIGGANDRQDNTQLFQTKQTFRKDLSAQQAKLATDLERVDRAETVLNSPNFLADAVAAPEVLQIMAGGMGSGLRMTDAELNRVNSAQNKLDQFKAAIAKYGIGEAKTLQPQIRKNMKDLIDTVKTARERMAALMEETLTKIDAAKSPEEVDQIHSTYWSNKRKAGTTDTNTKKPAGVNPRIPEF